MRLTLVNGSYQKIEGRDFIFISLTQGVNFHLR